MMRHIFKVVFVVVRCEGVAGAVGRERRQEDTSIFMLAIPYFPV